MLNDRRASGEPDAGNPPVRFDEGEGDFYPSLLYSLAEATGGDWS